MEPADLNSPSAANDDARLQALLNQHAAPLADEGFSARVLASLPAAPAPSRARSPRFWVYLAGAIAGCGFALWQIGSWWEIQSDTAQAISRLSAALAAWNDPTFVLALVVAALSLAVAFQAELRRRLLR